MLHGSMIDDVAIDAISNCLRAAGASSSAYDHLGTGTHHYKLHGCEARGGGGAIIRAGMFERKIRRCALSKDFYSSEADPFDAP